MLILAALFVSCEKEITVDIPTTPSKIVVEGNIEQGQPPFVFLSWSQGYFEPIDFNTLENLYVKGATVVVSNGTAIDTLVEFCINDLPPQFEEYLDEIAEALGFSVEQLQTFNICAYTSLNQAIWGEEGKTYSLTVDYQEHYLTSETKICNLVPIDSLWFEIVSSQQDDSLGYVFGIINDPDTIGNAYRWYAKRINNYPAWEDTEIAGEQKDLSYIAPLGSVFDDQFFNGLQFEFGYYRGSVTNSNKRDDNDIERGFYKLGDTIAVRGCVIDRGVFDFYSSFEDQVGSQGSPFSIPFNLKSNVNGGYGVWAGYGAVYDTVICQ